MTLIAKDSSETKFAKFPLPEAGTTQAVCCAVWDLGLQQTMYKNDDGTDKVQHKLIIAWEIVQKIDAPESEYHGKPYMLSKKYTLSLGEKANLRKDLESWRGRPFTADELKGGFDIEKLYGINCFIGIKHDADRNDASKVYANVSAILPLPKGTEKITPLRARDEAPPKWVLEKQAQAIAEPSDDFPAMTEGQDEFPNDDPPY
jgi:hypothetical protein